MPSNPPLLEYRFSTNAGARIAELIRTLVKATGLKYEASDSIR